MNKLPMGWVKTPISTIFNPKQYKTVSTENLLNEGYTVYGANGKIGKYSEYTHEFPTIMVTCRGATCGNIHISEPYSYINGNAMALDCFVNPIYMNLKYWYYFFQFRKFNDVITGSAQPQITATNLKNIELFLAPKAEQDHIATLLDNHLSQVATISQKLNDILPIIKQFRQSVLAQAVSGKLTEDWRKENNLDFNWCKLSIQDVATVKTGKTPSRKEKKYWANGVVSWATSSATGSDFCYYTDEKISQIAVDECNLKPFPKGSLLLAMYGEGKTRGQVTELMIEATCNQACAVLIVNNDIALNKFIKLKLKENYERTRQLASGGNQPNLNLNKVREIELNLPPLPEQQQIVAIVERLFAVADTIETQVNEALERVGHLTQSILHQAFTGNLSADWRACNADLITGEHSATALLAQIKQAEPKSPRKKKAQ